MARTWITNWKMHGVKWKMGYTDVLSYVNMLWFVCCYATILRIIKLLWDCSYDIHIKHTEISISYNTISIAHIPSTALSGLHDLVIHDVSLNGLIYVFRA
jgi:hypothetical protein